MTCHEVHRALRGSDDADHPTHVEPGVARHLDGCPACRELAADGGDLARSLGEGLAATAASDRDGVLFERIAADVAADRTRLDRLRSRPTAQRLAIAAAVLAGTCIASLLLLPRPDLAVFPASRMLLTVAIYLGAGATLAVAALRSLASRPRRGAEVVLGLGLIAGPLLLALLPAAHRGHPMSLMGLGPMLWAKAIPCLMFGLATSVPLLAVLWVLERGGQTGRRRALLAATAAGLGGSLALHIHCAITLPPHLLAGHAPVPLVIAALWLAARTGFRRLSPHSAAI